MNILMITTFYPPHIGGVEYHVQTLSDHLAKRGHKLAVLTSMLPERNMCYSNKVPSGVDIFRLKTIFPPSWPYPALSSQGFTLDAGKTIKRIVTKHRIDLIHAHGHHYFLSWKAIDVAKDLGLPSVLTLHGLHALSPANGLANIVEEIFNHTVFRQELTKVSAIIGLTPKITDYARKYGPSSKNYFTIPNGVDQRIFGSNRKSRVNYRKKYGIDQNSIVVLFRGRFATVKGVLELAEASKLVAKRNSRAYFLFVGGGSLLNKLAEILAPIEQNCKIIGWSPANDIHELYIASDIFILPSKSEALPLTILEAMAARLHIVATPVGGIPEVLQMYPHKNFIEKLHPSEICNSILGAIAALEKRTLEPQPEQYECLKKFDWQKVACQVEDVYQSACA